MGIVRSRLGARPQFPAFFFWQKNSDTPLLNMNVDNLLGDESNTRLQRWFQDFLESDVSVVGRRGRGTLALAKRRRDQRRTLC
jgi:hypothetical protein